MTPTGSGSDSLAGTTALVTGGGRGVGAAIARELADAGARVAILARTPAQLNETAQSIGGLAVPADVTSEADVHRAIETIEHRLGPITLLVNNAGVGGHNAASWKVPIQEWWRVFEVNVLGPFIVTQAVLQGMVPRGQGRIVNVGSGASYTPAKGISLLGSSYGASKAALGRFTELLAAEAAPHGIVAFTVTPGYVHSELTRTFPAESSWTSPELIGRLVRVLASGRADLLSGRYIHAQYDNIEDLIARAPEVVAKDYHAIRLRLPESA